MRIVIVTEGVPSFGEGASRRIFYFYILGLLEQGINVRLISLLTHSSQIIELKKLEKDLETKGNFRTQSIRIKNPIISMARFRLQVNYSEQIILKKLVKENCPDLIILFDLRAALLASGDFSGRKIVWLGDLGSEVNWNDGILGIKSNNLTGIVRFPSVLSRQYDWHKLYTQALVDANKIIVGSYSSMDEIAKLGFNSFFLPFPWPKSGRVDYDVVRAPSVTPKYLMYGNLKGLGWRSQWDFLFSELYPCAKNQFGPSNFQIEVGGIEREPNWIHDEFKKRKELVWSGFIPNLTSSMATSHAVLVPLQVPVGNRTRILTAQASRCLVIAHKNASRGNPLLINGFNCLLADSASKFVSQMLRAFEDKSLTKTIVENAEQNYLSTYEPSVANKTFINFIMN